MSYNDTVSTEAEQGPTHMLIHRQDTHTHHRNYSHTARVQQAVWSWSATRPARKCRKRCTAAHAFAARRAVRSELSLSSAQAVSAPLASVDRGPRATGPPLRRGLACTS